MNPLHLSDEAVAAFADGVLRGSARERAARHADACPECRLAVRAQREAVLALRSAPAPALPGGLFERLQALPAITPLPAPPTVFTGDGSGDTCPRTSDYFGQMSAFVPTRPAPRTAHRIKPLATGAAVLVLTAGTLVASASVRQDPSPTHGEGTVSIRTGAGDHVPPVDPEFVGARFARR